MKLNEFQLVARDAYADTMDDPSYLIEDQNEADKIGDTLFEFVMIELSDIEDCDSFEEALKRIQGAIDQLLAVSQALSEKL